MNICSTLWQKAYALLVSFCSVTHTWKPCDGGKVVCYILIGCKTQRFVVRFGWGCGLLSFIWPQEFTWWLADSWLTNKYGHSKWILPYGFLRRLTQWGRPNSEVSEITQCLEITRQCQRNGVSNKTSIQLFDLGKGGFTGWLTDHPKVRWNQSNVCYSVNVEAISEIWYWVTWPTFKAKQQLSYSCPRSDIPLSLFEGTCIHCVC